jgi:hypothetical protein
MRVFLQVIIPFGLFVAVLLTPFFLQRDLRNDDGDANVDPHTEIDDVITETTSVDTDISEMTTNGQKLTTTTTSATKLSTSKAPTQTKTSITISSTTSATTISTSTTSHTTTTKTTTLITTTSKKEVTTRFISTSTTIETTTTTTTATTTATTTKTTTTILTTASTTTTTTLTTTTATTITTPTTTTIATTTTTEQDKEDPCPFQCSSRENCQIIVGDNPVAPVKGRKVGKLVASKQFRLNIGIDFPSDAANKKANLVHERASFQSSISYKNCSLNKVSDYAQKDSHWNKFRKLRGRIFLCFQSKRCDKKIKCDNFK